MAAGFALAQAVQVPAPAAPVAPRVSLWYRGTPAGVSRQDDLAVIRALGFTAVTWPASSTAGLAELQRQADVVGLVVLVAPEPAPSAAASPPAAAVPPLPASGAVDVPVATMTAADMPARVWRAIANGARVVSFDPGQPSGPGVTDAAGATPAWVRPALAIARQLAFNGHLFASLRPAPAVAIEPPAPKGLEVVLRQDERSWVLIATNTSRERALATSRLPAGVSPALWSNLLDGTAMSMLAQPDGPRWTLDLEPGGARIYVVNKY
jgi:hypothetical protein